MTPKELLELWDECNYYYRNRWMGAYLAAWRRLLDGGWWGESPDGTAYGF